MLYPHFMNINDNLKNDEVQSAQADSNITILLPNYIMITYEVSHPTHLYVDEVTLFFAELAPCITQAGVEKLI